jgi:hypothetical protein
MLTYRFLHLGNEVAGIARTIHALVSDSGGSFGLRGGKKLVTEEVDGC